MRLSGTFEGGQMFSFSTSLRQMAQFVADERAKSSSGLGLSDGTARARARANPFDVWVEAKYAGYRDTSGGAGIGGHFGLVTVGADYVLNPSLLVGTTVQFDSTRQRSSTEQSDINGHG